MIKKLGNSDGVKQRELIRTHGNKINDIIEYINLKEEYEEKRRLEFIKQIQETNPELGLPVATGKEKVSNQLDALMEASYEAMAQGWTHHEQVCEWIAELKVKPLKTGDKVGDLVACVGDHITGAGRGVSEKVVIDKSQNFYNYMEQAFHDHVLEFPDAENAQFESGWDMAQEYAEKFIGRHNQQAIEKLEGLKNDRLFHDRHIDEAIKALKAQELVGGTK